MQLDIYVNMSRVSVHARGCWHYFYMHFTLISSYNCMKYMALTLVKLGNV
jgi:hypothetical protein